MTDFELYGSGRTDAGVHALEAGVLHPDRVHPELGEIVAGLKKGRTSRQQLTIADLTGVGFQDTAIASKAMDLLC